MRRAFVVVIIMSSIVACVDLFHSTDFTTLCDRDAETCNTIDATANVDVPDVAVDGAVPEAFCNLSPDEARARAEHACGFLGACEGAAANGAARECMLQAL